MNSGKTAVFGMTLSHFFHAPRPTSCPRMIFFASIIFFYVIVTGNSAKLFADSIFDTDPDIVFLEAGGNALRAKDIIIGDAYSILAQSETHQDVRSTADLLTGASFSSMISTQIQRTDIIIQSLMDQITSVNFSQRTFSVWASGYGGIGNIKDNTCSGYDYHLYGGMVGVEFNALGKFRLGALYSLGKTSLDSSMKFGSMTADSQDNLIGGYAKWQSILLGGYSFLVGDYTFNRYETERNILEDYYSGKFNGSQWGVYFEKGWHATVGVFNLNSFFAIHYQNLRTDAFSEAFPEDCPGTLALYKDGMNFDSLRLFAGARTTYHLGMFSFSLNVTYVREFMDKNPCGMTSFVNGGDSVMIVGRGLGSDWINAGAGVKFSLGNCISFMANYNGNWGDSLFHTGVGTLRLDF